MLPDPAKVGASMTVLDRARLVAGFHVACNVMLPRHVLVPIATVAGEVAKKVKRRQDGSNEPLYTLIEKEDA